MDGHSSCGKSAMYRAVTLYAMRRGFIGKNGIDEESLRKELPLIKISFGHENGEQYTILNGENVERQIRGMEVSGNVSPISAIGFVREAMVELQREMGKKGAVIMDGRDIGTTVFPNAELKIFVTATDEIRARRRYDELILKGDNPVYEDVLKNVRERDYIDSHRAVSPLRQADDAIVLDNSGMSYQEQDDWLMEQYLKAAKD